MEDTTKFKTKLFCPMNSYSLTNGWLEMLAYGFSASLSKLIIV